MDQKNPSFWTSAIDLISGSAPMLYAVSASILLAVLRMVYEGRSTWQRVTCESAMCGLLAAVIMSGVVAFGFPESAATFVGGMVGFLGVEKIRKIAEQWLGHRIPR